MLTVLVLILLILACAYCSASEVALFSLSHHKVKTFAQSSLPRQQKVAELLESPTHLLVTIFMLNTLAIILLQNVASNLFQNTSGWLYKVGVPLVVTLLFGEIIPKYVAIRNNIFIALQIAPSIDFLQKILAPIRKLIVSITSPVSRIMFFFLSKEPGITKDEIIHALDTAKEQHIISDDEAEFVFGYLDLLEASVKELMQPKEDILFFNIHSPLTKLVHLFTEQKCTRVPVCDYHLDKILGVITAPEYFVSKQNLKNSSDLLPLLRKPMYVPEVIPAKSLLKRFYREKETLALAVDEYGSLSGLITLEDIAEVVIGNVTDQRDQTSYTLAGKNEIIASGRMELSELNDFFETDLSSENMVTIGGWLIEQLGGLPQTGTKYEKEGLLFHIISVSPRRIERIYIRKTKDKR